MPSVLASSMAVGVMAAKYCPSADDLTVAYCDKNNKEEPCPQLFDQGWTIEGGGGAATKSAFNLNGGYVEYDVAHIHVKFNKATIQVECRLCCCPATSLNFPASV